MDTSQALDDWLATVTVDRAVHELRPDYRVMLIAATGLVPGAPDDHSEKLLTEAEADPAPLDHPHLEAWREAFRAFGAKPQRTRPSADALIRRAGEGLPRIDRLTDVYNAVSVQFAVPVGGEDLDHYVGAARLVRADGTEPFEVASGVEHPHAGEVVWRDEAGVTCRRWNWRQCVRTRLGAGTTRALFILDALEGLDEEGLESAADALHEGLASGSPDAVFAFRLVKNG